MTLVGREGTETETNNSKSALHVHILYLYENECQYLYSSYPPVLAFSTACFPDQMSLQGDNPVYLARHSPHTLRHSVTPSFLIHSSVQPAIIDGITSLCMEQLVARISGVVSSVGRAYEVISPC